MPRVSREQAEKHRVAIERAASRLFRERGLEGISVAQIMAAAGLTHGGFYGHFLSKGELAARACSQAFEQSAVRWHERQREYEQPQQALDSIVAGFLAARHRDHPGGGCPAVALAGDVAREAPDQPVHRAYAEGIAGQLEILSDLCRATGASDPRPQAAALLATMVGAVVLARATLGTNLSDEILAAALEKLCGADTAQAPAANANPARSRRAAAKRPAAPED